MAPSSVGSTTLTAPSSPTSPTRSDDSRTSQGTTDLLLNNINHHGRGIGGSASTGITFARIREQDDDMVDGWPKLAKLMDDVPALAAFPRFQDANIKILLSYQVEIAHLQALLKLQEQTDRSVPTVENEFHSFPDKMFELPGYSQRELIEKLRKCVHQYNRALLEYAQVSALPEPSSRNITKLVEWLSDGRRGKLVVNGAGSELWGDQFAPVEESTLTDLLLSILRSIFLFWKEPDPPRTRSDLVVPRLRDFEDGLTRWIRAEWMPLRLALTEKWTQLWTTICRSCWIGKTAENKSPLPSSEKAKSPAEEKKDAEDKVGVYSGKSMERFTSGVVTVVASMLPTMAIAILTTADTLRDKLLYIGGFTALFSIGLMVLTSETSRVQIFTATAAFSAVLVVFVQN
ncbi:putative isoleucyl-tRNA synthetase [Rhypophila decipiens]